MHFTRAQLETSNCIVDSHYSVDQLVNFFRYEIAQLLLIHIPLFIQVANATFPERINFDNFDLISLILIKPKRVFISLNLTERKQLKIFSYQYIYLFSVPRLFTILR